jgi:hypothetical protein
VASPRARLVTGTALLWLGVLVVGDLDRTWALVNVAVVWTIVLTIDFLISFSYTLFPRRASFGDASPRRSHSSITC